MPREPVRLGTRGSPLALWQARWVSERLAAELGGARIEIIPVRTRGDSQGHGAMESAGLGHFTSDLEAALAQGRVDLAVHSLKDLPVAPTPGLVVAAVPLRGDPADALVARSGLPLSSLPAGAVVGTSSPRRTSLLRSRRPDLVVRDIRGNVDTRVRQVDEGLFDAVVLAVAGLKRLGLEGRIAERFDPGEFPPAPGQGALAVQVRGDEEDSDGGVREAVARLDDQSARAACVAERTLLGALGGGCRLPVGAYARKDGGSLRLTAFVGSIDGRRVLHVEEVGTDPKSLGQAAAERLLSAGAQEVLE